MITIPLESYNAGVDISVDTNDGNVDLSISAQSDRVDDACWRSLTAAEARALASALQHYAAEVFHR